MKTILGFGVYTLLVLFIPIYGTYIYERLKAKDWRRGILHSVIALAVATLIFELGLHGISPTPPPKRPALAHLKVQHFYTEIEARRRNKLMSSSDDALMLARNLFEQALYVAGKNDPDRAMELYGELQRGRDFQNKEFLTFPSVCVENNLAVDTFQKSGNKGFIASSLLLDADSKAKMLGSDLDEHEQVVKQNIDDMDRYANP